MLDITSHISSYREAKAFAIVKVSKEETMDALFPYVLHTFKFQKP